ncbi:hypothetical protein F183_A38230 [Bryobacterales bacterium F-183]|nr:hypothetical protein F183_A38230 [Bryobacterales bacterium F-183]
MLPLRAWIACLLLFAASSCSSSKTAAAPVDLDTKFRKFIEGGITLVGRSSSTRSDKISSEERYTISSASKLTGDTWLLTAKFKYKDQELPIPVPVSVRWAGDDTPVLCLTDVGVPGMGSYTARVVLHGDQYAGTWSSSKGGYGGQLFGKIVRGTP